VSARGPENETPVIRPKAIRVKSAPTGVAPAGKPAREEVKALGSAVTHSTGGASQEIAL
jgi:hypothetical protein